MTVQRVESVDDPRIAAYRDLKGRALRGEGLFVTEGRLLTMRLLASRHGTESVLVADRFAEEFQSFAGEGTVVYVASEQLLSDVVGFDFHRGVLACGRRGPGTALGDLMAAHAQTNDLTLIVCPEVADGENLGSLFRIAAAFGVDGVVLGGQCCDPFSRRCLRVSMGGVLRVPLVESPDLPADLADLKRRWSVELVAAVLDETAEPLDRFRRPPRVALVFGSESTGLAERWLSLCDRRLTIPMQPGTDSLNLAVAAGIFVYHMTARPAS